MGKNVRFAFSSRHRGFGDVIRALLPRIDEDCLDNASIDLRDYFAEKRDAGQRAKESDIPSSDVLDSSFRSIHLNSRVEGAEPDNGLDTEKANQLRRLANELRISGLLLQALEAFRRAAILRPRDAKLLFEFAECIRSVAGSESDEKLERRAKAMMRLAERYAHNDSRLLSRIGESYFQIGEWRRAGIVFKRVADAVGENFRTLRGQAELALREGKIAHVIHNFSAAEQLAGTTSLRRWTQSEIDYFSHLNEDEEYMELEISRVNLLDTLDRTKRSSFRVNLFGFVAIALGLTFGDDLVANIGWAVSGISLTVWIVTMLMSRMLSPRIPFELMETDE
jgi:tetratricopeptide (TPR) repeat protein